MANSVRVVVKIIARAEAVDAMKAVVVKLAERSHAENGCISYEALQDQSAPERFVLVEEWSSAEALDAHNRTPHFHEAVAAAGPLLAAPLEVGRYTAIG